MAKLAPGGQRYYLEQAGGPIDHPQSVASGVEDYYTAGNEPPGHWLGAVAAELGLADRVVDEQSLHRVLAHEHPRTGEVLPGPAGRARVPGFDLTFSVPKSASVLCAVGDRGVRDAVWRAQRVAVCEALRYLETEAARGRLGAGGQAGWFEGSGLLAAAFEQRTSRAGDPQVHTHVLVANLVRRPDGLWAALDGRLLYAESKTAGYVHEAAFRRALVTDLGVEWGPVRKGIAEVTGVPTEVLRSFSRRSRQIDAYLAVRGGSSAAARQVAAYRTREAKDYGVRPERLAVEWRARAKALGFSHDELALVLNRAPVRTLGADEIAAWLRDSGVLTEHSAHFARREVIRHAAELAQQGATLAELVDAAGRYVDGPDVIPLLGERDADVPDRIRLRSGRVVSFRRHRQRYSTVSMLAAERRVLDTALAQRGTSRVLARETAVDRALDARPSMGADQAAVVRRLCLERDGVQVVIGRAGTGKTFALAAAREAWEASGVTVRGAAVARAAARNLERSSGIPSTSVAAMLAQLARGDPAGPPGGGVLVVDEAGMLGTRDLDTLLTTAATRSTKVVLVGDDRQLPEIAAGGAFSALSKQLPAIELTVNHRQREPHARDLLEALRAGNAEHALRLASDHGDLALLATDDDVLARLVADYCQAAAGGRDAIMLALRRSEVAELNHRARAWMDVTGRLGTERIRIGETELAAGDRIVLRNNNPHLAVQNGSCGQITAIETGRRGIAVVLDTGEHVALPETYLRGRADGQPAIQHGYAATAHVAQGTTVDDAFVLVSDAAHREWAYVALSRARTHTQLYASAESLGLTGSQRHDFGAAQARLVQRLQRTQAQTMALEHHPDAGTPEYILGALGPPPDRPSELDRWERTAAAIEDYRMACDIHDPNDPLGPRPPRPRQSREWLLLHHTIAREQRRISRAVDHEIDIGP